MDHKHTQSAVATQPVDVARQRAIASGIFAMMLGLFLVFGTGLAQPDMLHNAAHDARHAFAFPCH
jgi:cobalt transporter subunit CbtB